MSIILLLLIWTIILGGFGGLIFLQIFLSKRDNRVVGLILPIVSFVMAILIASAVVAGMVWNVGTSSDDMAIQEYVEEYDGETVIIDEDVTIEGDAEDYKDATLGVVPGLIVVFVMFNIPTVVYLVIYFVCRSKRRKKLENSPQKQLEKMNIQDLG